MLPSYVKQKPAYWKYIPWLSGPANTIYPYIYMPKRIFADLNGENPTPASLATLVHEETHLKRQRQLGILKYALLYIGSRHFRFQEELAAIRPQMRLLNRYGIIFNIHTRAKALAGWEYLWCATYTEALRQLKKLQEDSYK